MSVLIKKIISKDDINLIIHEIISSLNISKRSKVFIKPNLSGRPPILKGENTSFEILQAVVIELIKRECTILIGHYPLLVVNKSAFPFIEMIKVGGYSKLLKYPQVSFVNLEERGHKVIKIRNLNIVCSTIIDDVDYFFNIAKAKTHMITDVSLSLKNLMGLIDGSSRKIFHKFFLNELIGYLGLYLKPDINIIDGIVGMEGNGPHEGSNIQSEFIASGNDMVELDSVLSYLMGFDYEKIIHINTAKSLGVGLYPSRELLNRYNKDLIQKFIKPSRYMQFGKKIFFWPTTSCSMCHEIMRNFKYQLKINPILALKFYYYSYYSKKRINIILGRCEHLEYLNDDINILIGVCTSWFAKDNGIQFISGCPPNTKQVIDFIFSNVMKNQ